MDIQKEQIDDLNAVLKVKVEESDYQQKVDDVLKDYRKKAKVDGFRPGKVPMGYVKKMYYLPVLVDEVNKMVSDKLFSYISENELRILGEPLPSGDQEKVDFETQKDFEFSFDIGIAPEFSSEISEKDKIPYYNIEVDDKTIDEWVDSTAKRFGDFVPVDEAKGDELIKGKLYAVDDEGNQEENAPGNEEASMSLDMIKDDDEKKKFIGAKAGDKVVFDLKKAYPNDAEISSLLKIDKEKVAELPGKFEIEINEVLKFDKHEINQELFDKVYGEGAVKSEDEFREKIAEEVKANFDREANYKFFLDAKDYMLKRADISLPTEFLKKWLVKTNENLNDEKVEEEFSKSEDEFKWQLLRDKMIRDYEIKVDDEELFQYAAIMARNQFYQYGLQNVPDEYIVNYAREQMEKPEEKKRLTDQKLEEKLIAFIKEKVKLDEKKITMDKFRKLFE